MNEKQLEQEILRLHDPHGANINEELLKDEKFIENQYPALSQAFKISKHRDWKWQHFVRVVLEPPEKRQYMYERLLSLLLTHKKTYTDYFILRTEEGVYPIPNILADLNRLEVLYQKYFEIFRNIKEHIHFDYPKNDYIGPIVKGKINWDKTIKNSSTLFPTQFVSSVPQKEFETAENILLILCAKWMNREANRLLQIKFDEPLTDYKKNLLQGVIEKTKVILDNFPFVSVLNSSKRFWELPDDDPRIRTLEEITKQRLRQRRIKNLNYAKLLDWIKDFRELQISRVSSKTPTKRILDSIKNLDTVYEAWIFLEFVEFLHKKGLSPYLNLKEDYCQFEYDKQVVKLLYNHRFDVDDGYAWADTSQPDFTVMVNNEIVAVFDAKNYTKNELHGPQQIILSYMTNLDVNLGGLFFPYYPSHWDEIENRDIKINKLVPILKKKFPHESDYEIKSRAKKLSKLSLDNLSEYPDLPQHSFERFAHPGSGKRARYHFEQELYRFRMSPENTKLALDMKNESLTMMFNAIISRIPLTVKS